MTNERVSCVYSFFKPLIFWVVLVSILSERVTAESEEQSIWGLGPLVKKNQRARIISTEYGEVSEARVTDGNEAFQLHFITLEPNSLFLPVMLHYDMVFYVQTGSGKLSYLDKDEKEERKLRRGDVHRLRSGAFFFIQSDLETERQKLRIIAIFDNSDFNFNDPAFGPYSSIRDLILGFDDNVLRAVFKAPESVIAEIRNGTRPAAIIHGLQKKRNTIWETEYELMEAAFNIFDIRNKHKKKSKLFNVFDKDPDFKNCNGWSTTVDKKKYGPLKGSKYGIFMVYLTAGSMMGPHWNPMGSEIAVGVEGKGMIHVVCSRMVNASECKNSRYLVEEGDLFVVPKFHAMAQMAFNNETFAFMGFSTSIRINYPQYLAGNASVLLTLDKRVMAASLAINVSTYDKFSDQKGEAIILRCISCAEEEWIRVVEEAQSKEEEKRKEEEEARRKEEEKRREEEEARKKEEEEAERKREEEEAQKKREEEEAWKRWEEEERKRQEEARKKEEEEAERKREEEEARKKKEEEEAWKRREEEERKRQEEAQKKKEEEEARKRWEEEERKRQEREERERQEQQQREQEEKAQRKREEEEAQKKREEEEARRRWEEEERKRQEQQRRWEEEERKRQEQQQQEQEERERQKQQREQEKREAEEREQEQAQEAEREREAQARREEAAKEEAAAHGQGGSEGQGQWGEGQEKQVPEGERGQGQWGEVQGEAHGSSRGRGQQKSAKAQEEQGGAQGWARRIFKKIA